MKTLFSFLLAFITIVTMAGCSADNGKNGGFDTPKKSQEKPARTKYRTFVSDEELKTQKEIAQIEAKKQIELQKISKESELKALALQREKELELLKEKERLLAIEHEQAMQRYLLLGGILLLLLAGALLLWYLDRRRKDKLRAYEDNLQKYFRQKENEARVKIAEKILDTVASQDLGIEQKTKLIEALHGPVAGGQNPQEEQKDSETNALENSDADDTIVIEPQEDDHDEPKTGH